MEDEVIAEVGMEGILSGVVICVGWISHRR